MAKSERGFRVSIFAKMFVITFVGFLLACLYLVKESGKVFERTSKLREQDTRGDQVLILREVIETQIIGLIEKAKVVGSLIYRDFSSEDQKNLALELTFRDDNDLLGVSVYKLNGNQPILVRQVLNEKQLKYFEKPFNYLDLVRSKRPFQLMVPFYGKIEFQNSTIDRSVPIITIGLPLVKDPASGLITEIVVADIQSTRIQKSFIDTTGGKTYLADTKGFVLASSDEEMIFNNLKLDPVHFPVFRAAQEEKDKNNLQQTFTLENGKSIIGAFARTRIGLSVITEIPLEIIMEPSIDVKNQAYKIMFMVLSALVFFTIVFSSTITDPIARLVVATREIKKGNFNVASHINTNDEVGQLAEAFDEMVVGLKDRDKYKSMITKFHGTSVAQKMMSGNISLGGEQKEAIVFFSDIRGFTSFSEKVTPQEVVDMLNEYFKVMVQIIEKFNGVVDKFVGDAIMAIWGAVDARPDDIVNAVKASLEMRRALAKLNDERVKRSLTPIYIGMSLHVGPLIVGTIGTENRMDYTVIGDTVNLSSRIEQATKFLGNDFLISEEVRIRIQGKFVTEPAGEFTVDGKDKPILLHRVNGYIDKSGKPVLVESPYAVYDPQNFSKTQQAG